MPTQDSTDKDFHDYLTGLNTGYSGGTMMGELGKSHRGEQPAAPTTPTSGSSPFVMINDTVFDGIADGINDWFVDLTTARTFHVFALLVGVGVALAAIFIWSLTLGMAPGVGIIGWVCVYAVPRLLGGSALLAAACIRIAYGLLKIATLMALGFGLLWLAATYLMQ
ncbi:MAG: hypothetical protein ACQEVT_17820 [Pseudomonadota bacterium]|uniref:hypothetical protein n=1 Tax=Roseovarius salincola TaxID=2978479 RepID=UPI0022A84601|nr:hypothetical protein [Roseovarius sp. EGI FJ00037]MCZ0814301.1 hypothetical protein [Roseovarius sp. EGI FJ00037]